MYEQLHQYLKVLQQERKLTTNSYQSYERDLLKFTGYLEGEGVKGWTSVHKHHTLKYMMQLKEADLKPATIARHVVSIRALFHYLIIHDFISHDPSIFIEAPKLEKKVPQIISQEDTNRLLQVPDLSTAVGIRDKAMLELLYATGIRVTELVSLNVDHVHLSLGFIQVISPSQKERFVPFGNYAKEAIEAYLEHGRAQLAVESTQQEVLFLNHHGGRITRQGFWKIIKKYALEAGVSEEITPHTLRHSVAAHLLENGADVRAVQEILGHVDITSTMKYTSIAKSKMKDVYSSSHPRA
ncbi:MAG: site-specific tyrosine recombinase XerD [Candidatus Pristimantibacillus lignocellulolyticus]|uniref:Tyrosine recombinase XerC n=1 Tax=Candidatus Pristimantibacillus lignocellulolyticus TaxID=2994561 RepID=A0A9J6ZDD3_9BACL|nr:MAG: site-specific tyrosine recombinase XerD [Candidatus Pristimantibacillus lignocellulolyticus]